MFFLELISYTHFIAGSLNIESFYGDVITDGNSLHALVTSVHRKSRSNPIDLFQPQQNLYQCDEYTEICINRTLLESDIFTGGKINIGGSIYIIAAQSGGTGQTDNYNLQTKIIIDCHVNENAGTEVMITLPVRNGSSGFINDWMIFRLKYNETIKDKSDGEILLRGTKNDLDEQVLLSARVMSDFYSTNNSSELEALVRIPKKINYLHTAQNLLQGTGSNKIIYFEPYETDITNSIASASIAGNEALKSIHFSVETTDNAGNKSTLSQIAQFIKTRSKEEKPNKPNRPYPCGNADATEAYLNLPNSEGRSTFCLLWDDVKDNTGVSMRYEVGRALDKTIVAAHKDLWLKGVVPTYSATTTVDTSITNSAMMSNGLISAELGRDPNANFNPEDFKGGRLFQRLSETFNGTTIIKYYEIVQCYLVEGKLKLTLRQMAKDALADNTGAYSPVPPQNVSSQIESESPLKSTTCTMETIPDYSDILENDTRLIELANLTRTNEFPNIPDGLGAFSLVTGQPLRNTTQLIDDVPGLGSSRFFYKVRSVDASENRSAWTPCSVPVWQLDTTLPEPPVITSIEGQEQSACIKWKNEKDNKIAGYHIYRTDEKINNGLPNQYETEKLIKTFMKQNIQNGEFVPEVAKIRHRFNMIELPFINELKDSSNRITGVIKLNSNDEPDTSLNCLIMNPTLLDGQNIINLHPSIRDGERVVVVLNSSANTEVVVYKNSNGNLISQSGIIALPSVQGVNSQAPIKGIFILQQYDFGKLAEDQISENFLVRSPSIYVPEKSLLKEFYSLLIDCEKVAVQITKADGTIFYISEDDSEFEYNDDLKNSLNLDLNYNYRMDTIKIISIANVPVRIISRKSAGASVQIKMNTPPPLPEILSAEWWDLSTDAPASTASVNTGVKIVIRLINQNGYCILKKQNPSSGFFETRQTNLNQFILQPDGSFRLTIINPNNEIHSRSIYQVEFISSWEGKSSSNFELKGL